MKFSAQLREEMEKDIDICEKYPSPEGSESLCKRLLAKYSAIDKGFKINLCSTGKAVSIGQEFDFRQELLAVAEKLKMWLLIDQGKVADVAPDLKVEANVSPLIFISHRSTDKDIAEMLCSFLVATGVPRSCIFCSSLPGNDVKQKISAEVKLALKTSSVNVIILSADYYNSAYCLNEAGIIWFEDTLAIPIALPEISPDNMLGFFNDEYKVRCLDCDSDITYIYESICKGTSTKPQTATVIMSEVAKLKKLYSQHIESRVTPSRAAITLDINEFTTDDERIILYYILSTKVRKISKTDVSAWLRKNEIYGVNIENAFDLLSASGSSKLDGDSFELDLATFRKYTSRPEDSLTALLQVVNTHRILSSESFTHIWEADQFNDSMILFVAYIIDEHITSFGDRWMAEAQIKNIRDWELKNSLDSILSRNYGSCLGLFIHKNFVYASGWTKDGNPREYKLHRSLKEFLFSDRFIPDNKLEEVKKCHIFEFPF